MKKVFNNRTIIIVFGVLLIAAFLRLYRISDYMVFLGDEGRDVLVAKHILDGDFTLLGPRSSAADFFYGPIYYYFITPFLLLFNYDPVGPSVFVALVGIATVYLVYKVASDFFGFWPGIISSLLYAIAPLPIIYSRSSWNPNPLPFFSLLSLYLVFKAEKGKSYKLLFAVGILLGTALQLHYLSLFLGSVVAIFILVSSILQKTQFIVIIDVIKKYLVVASGVLIGLSLFLLFEIRHGFPNTLTIYNFVFYSTVGKETVHDQNFFEVVSTVFSDLFLRLFTMFPRIKGEVSIELQIWASLVMILVTLLVVSIFFIKDSLKSWLFGLWLGVGVLLFGFYSREIFDYFFAFLFPLPFLLVGSFISWVSSWKKYKNIGIAFSAIVIGGIAFAALAASPLKMSANAQKNQTKTIAEFVLSKTDNKSFNFALLTPGNSDHAYRYYFEVKDRKPIDIQNESVDPERKTITDQLLIVCENPPCNPLGHPLWEVAGFGRAEIVGEWKVSVVTVYKLKHFQE